MPKIETKSGFHLVRRGNWLIAELGDFHDVLSWAVVNGGRTKARRVAWLQVTAGDLAPPIHPEEYFRKKMTEEKIEEAVGFLTSGNIDRYAESEKKSQGLTVRTVVTAGMSNALRVGDAPGKLPSIGTINLLCRLSVPLSEEALVEAVSIAAEARTLAVLETDVPSIQSAEPATGTGTDCIVIASPNGTRHQGDRYQFCGKHTALGSLIGSSVLEATRMALKNWKKSKL